MRKRRQLFSALMALCFAIMSITKFANANAEWFPNRSGFLLPDFIDPEEDEKEGYIGRVISEENDLYTYVFEKADGSHTMRVFGQPVKYIADDGEIRDISLGIRQNKSGGFVSADHEIITTFANYMSGGVSLDYADISISLFPQALTEHDPEAILSDDGKVVTYQVDDATSYTYVLTGAGFKEDIIVNEYTGQTDYEFILQTNGLSLGEEYGSFYLSDSDGAIKAIIGDAILFSENDQENSIEKMSVDTIITNSVYLITISIDPDHIENVEYPIHIDPTIEINYSNNGSGAIEDVTINNNTTFSLLMILL